MTRSKLTALLVLSTFLCLTSVLVIYNTHQLATVEERFTSVCTYEQVGKYDYTAKLKPNLIYNQTTLKPGEGIPYLKITELVNTTFFYIFRLSGLDRPANITIEYSIDVYLETPQWRKRLNIAPNSIINSTKYTVDLSADYLVNISSVEAMFEALKSETGASTSTYNLTISPQIHAVAITDVGTIDEYFTPSMTIKFMYRAPEGDHILIEGLTHTRPGAITRNEKIYYPSVMKMRYASYAFSASTFSALAYLAWMFIKMRPARVKKSLEEIIEPFEEIIVEIAEEPSYEGQRVAMKTLEDLVKLSDGLGKPVFHSERSSYSRGKASTHTFYVLDGLVRYEYTITAPSIEEKAEPETVIDEEENENSD